MPGTETMSAEAILEQVNKKFGFIPNVLKELSASPPALHVYLSGQDALAKGVLTAKEQQVVQLTVAAYNDCHYCQAAHQFLGKTVGINPEDLEAIREGKNPGDAAAALVHRVTVVVLEKRGWVDQEQVTQWEGEGLARQKLYEIIAYIGLKTITNYVNHIAQTPVDEVFKTLEKE